MKQCYNCKQVKALFDFYKNKSAKDKHTGACIACMTKRKKEYKSTKHGFLTKALYSAKTRAKNKNVPINLNFKYVESIATDICPIFNIPLLYSGTDRGQGNTNKNTASLDRIIPELGYVMGNVVFISHWANTIKQDATEKELYAIADWLHDARKKVLNAKEITTTSVSAGDHIEGAVGAELGSISTPWTWQDDDNTDHNSGTVSWEDFNYRTKESS